MTALDVYNVMIANSDWNIKAFLLKQLPIGSNSRMSALHWAMYRARLMRNQAARYAADNGVSL